MGPVVVTVDGWELNASRHRGIGTYLWEVLGRLPLEDDLEVQALTPDRSLLPPGVEAVPIRRRVPRRFQARVHGVRLPSDLRRAGGDVVWSPGQDPPRRSPVPFVQTLLDATPLLRPHADTAAAARRMRKRGPRYRAAAAWIAISGHTADSCAKLFGLPRDRIEVVHLGAGAAFRPHPDRRGSPSAAARDGSPYVLYVGEFGAHKGFAEAFAVAAGLADRGLQHRVRMVGRVAPWWQPRIDALLAAAARPDRVDVCGYVDDLVGAYQGASALILTSRQEGFGLPLVEAMACATPVVAFANSSLPEVVGDGGAVVPDGDVVAIVEALVPLLTDDRDWREASDRALARAAHFRWDVAAAAHARVLRRAAGRG